MLIAMHASRQLGDKTQQTTDSHVLCTVTTVVRRTPLPAHHTAAINDVMRRRHNDLKTTGNRRVISRPKTAQSNVNWANDGTRCNRRFSSKTTTCSRPALIEDY